MRTTLPLAEEYMTTVRKSLPEGMLAVVDDAYAMAVEADHFATAMQARAVRASEHPLHPAIKDLYDAVAKVQRDAANAAAEIAPMIERLHKAELDRLRNPRTNEDMWDLRANKDAA